MIPSTPRLSLASRLAALAIAALAFGCAEGSPGTQLGPPDATIPKDSTPADDSALPDADVAPPTRCARNEDCAASPLGAVCDTVTGTCAQCTPAQDTCPPGQLCEPASNTCVTGCTTDADCGTGGVTRCDTATHRCVGCTADADCALGTICRTGSCVPGCSPKHACGVGQTCCDGQCADLQSSAMNCGACGSACSAGGACCAGACRVVATNAMNCGRCGNACAAANGTPACVEGACAVSACDMGFGDCDRDASNGCEAELAANAMNCGACGRPCTSGPNATSRCMASRCVNECAGGFGDCDDDASNGCETAVTGDARHCGRCGNACPGGANATPRCAAGACGLACAAGFGDCDGDAANGCETNLNTTVTACGACGVTCRYPNGNASCGAGLCSLSTCAAGFDNCDGNADNGCETPTSADSSNCGRCGNRCPTGTACSMGACNSVCSGGTTFCSGRCVALDADPTACGSCSRACPGGSNATAACRGGACALTCDRGFGDCDGDPSNGCETNLRTTTAHCGACGALCRPSNAAASCVDGACRVGACDTGFASCNGSDADGCEVRTSADVSNCGACGRACSLANAGAVCVSGSCAVSACASGFANCNGVDGDGCEVNTGNNNFNCGRCGLSCAPGTACSGASCATICSAGTTYCAGSCVSLATDARNCGACGNVCGAGQSCSGGVCRVPAPSNDTCAGATTLSLASAAQTISLSNLGANTDLATPCGFGGSEVWYRFTLSQRELVYADTVGTSFDTILYFASSCTAALSGSPVAGTYLCNDDMSLASCTGGGLQSQVVGLFNAGTYYLVFAGYSNAMGPATIHFQHLAVGGGAVTPLNAGASTNTGSTTGGSALTPSCGYGTGPESTYWWKSCPDTAAGAFSATTCSRATWDTILDLRNATNAGDACNDDSCGPYQSTISSTIGAGAGLHVLTIDGFAGASGSFTLQVTRP